MIFNKHVPTSAKVSLPLGVSSSGKISKYTTLLAIKISQYTTLPALRQGGLGQPLEICFIDFQKAFDCVARAYIWDQLRALGLSRPFFIDYHRYL
jgi:hypothetical protein